MPYQDIEDDIIKAEVKAEVIKKVVKKEVDYNIIYKKLEDILSTVQTGSKYNEHMRLGSIISNILSTKNNYTLKNDIDEVISYCNTSPKFLQNQLKLSKNIKKLLK